MRTASGLVIFLLCTYAVYAYVLRSVERVAAQSSFTPSTSDENAPFLPAGEYAALRAELGLMENPSHLSRLSTESFHKQIASPHSLSQNSGTQKDVSSEPLAHRAETAGLTDLRDESWHHIGLRKMRRRTSTFGLGIDFTHLSTNIPSAILPLPSLSPRRVTRPRDQHFHPSHTLHFAVDALREPCTSSEHVVREYVLFATKESALSGSGSSKTARGGNSAISKSSSKNSAGSTSRAGSTKRARGGRRLPPRIEH